MYEILKQLLSPCGLIWLALFALVWLARKTQSRKLLAGISVLLVAYTVAGNYWLASYLSDSNDTGYVDVNPWAEGSYDAIGVLGGGISTSSHGYAYLNRGGDRIMLGARLYFAQRTPHLVATGRSRRRTAPDPSDSCADIWRELQIPESSISKVGGLDTVEELHLLQELSQRNGWKNVGLITSVNHMPRAMQYASKIGFDLHPLPAGSSGRTPAWNFREHLVPDARALLLNQYLIYEFVGGMIQ